MTDRLHFQDSLGDNLRAAPVRAVRALQSLTARPNPEPIFILGHQKSGTSAVAGLLAQLTGCSVTIDLLNEDRRPTFQRVTSGNLSFERFLHRNRLDFSRDIVKEPNLTFLFPQLIERFPNARFVMIVRDPRTNIKSVLDRLKLPGDLSEISDEDRREMRRGWTLVFDPSWLSLPPGSYIEILAERWNRCVDIYLNKRRHFLLVRYEDFVANKLETLESLARELNLSVVADISSRLDHQFQPSGDRRTPAEQFFNPENLAKIERICAPGMQELAYDRQD